MFHSQVHRSLWLTLAAAALFTAAGCTNLHLFTYGPPDGGDETNGTYTVDPDCTGSFFDANGTKSNNLVVLDGGKRFFLLSVAPGTITTEEGKRLEVED